MTQTLPLTWADESVLHLESAFEPCNSQMEIGETQRIDPTELEAAVHAACMAHPIARSRLVVGAAHQQVRPLGDCRRRETHVDPR